MPFVIEAHGGGLAPMARRVVAHIAKAVAARDGEVVEPQADTFPRRISISVHRENARVVLRRLPGTWVAPSGVPPEAWGENLIWH